jgi:hypothetical protein
MTRIDLDRLIVWAAQDVSLQARLLLCFYATHLSIGGIEQGMTAVYPGQARSCAFLGVSPASLKRYKRELEDAGYILRRYDNRNRPLQDGAIDLRPLLTRKEELMAKIAQTDQKLGRTRADQRSAGEGSSLSPEGITYEPLNRALETFKDCTVLSIIDGSGQGRGGEKPPITEGSGTALKSFDAEHQEADMTPEEASVLNEVLRHAPRLDQAIPQKARTSREEALGALIEALPGLFPEDRPSSISHTGRWGARSLGVSLFAAVALAAEDPEVKAPSNYLGRLVHPRHNFNLEMALARLRKLRPAPAELPVAADRFQDEITKAVAGEIGVEVATSYLHPERTRIMMEDNAVVIEIASKTALMRVLTAHRAGIERALARIGLQEVLFRAMHQTLSAGEGSAPRCPPVGESA